MGMLPLSTVLKKNLLIVTTDKKPEKITSVEIIGYEDTMDLEIDSKFHNFYANGICVSNSHCVSYSYISCQTLYLKHYYPTEFYTALLNHQKTGGDKEKEQQWLAATISSAMSKGIKILPPSLKSGWDWTMTGEKEISMGFSGINGLGDKAYEELILLLEQGGETLGTIKMSKFFNLPFSKFNKSAFSACLKAGVFDSWSNSREHLSEIKNKKKKKAIPSQMALFDLNADEFNTTLTNIVHPETTAVEKQKQFMEVCNFSLEKIEEIAAIKNELYKRSGNVIESILNFSDDNFYFFRIEGIQEVTSEKGMVYLSIKAGDGISQTTLRVFPPRRKSDGDLFEKIKASEVGGVYVAEFVKNKQGFINLKQNGKFGRVK